MEFRFNLNDVFKKPIVEVGPTLVPEEFKGDRRGMWDALAKVTDVINAMGAASATAQGLTRPITTADRLRNSNQQQIYLLLDQSAFNGKGAVTGMLKTGRKGLYVFDREGHHYHVQSPCILDFYVHESRQRAGYGKRLFEHMLQREAVNPKKLAIDRPSEKFLGFLNKHYSLNNPIRQMNNYVVYDGFFPNTSDKSDNAAMNNSGDGSEKRGSNGLQPQTVTSPYGRYGAPRPPCSMGQIIHNQSAAMPMQEPTGQQPPERQRTPFTCAYPQPNSVQVGGQQNMVTAQAYHAEGNQIVGNGSDNNEAAAEYHWPFAVPQQDYPMQNRHHSQYNNNNMYDLLQPGLVQQEAVPVKVPIDEHGRPQQQNGQKAHYQVVHRNGNVTSGPTLHQMSHNHKQNVVVDDRVSAVNRFNHFSQPIMNQQEQVGADGLVLPGDRQYTNLYTDLGSNYQQYMNTGNQGYYNQQNQQAQNLNTQHENVHNLMQQPQYFQNMNHQQQCLNQQNRMPDQQYWHDYNQQQYNLQQQYLESQNQQQPNVHYQQNYEQTVQPQQSLKNVASKTQLQNAQVVQNQINPSVSQMQMNEVLPGQDQQLPNSSEHSMYQPQQYYDLAAGYPAQAIPQQNLEMTQATPSEPIYPATSPQVYHNQQILNQPTLPQYIAGKQLNNTQQMVPQQVIPLHQAVQQVTPQQATPQQVMSQHQGLPQQQVLSQQVIPHQVISHQQMVPQQAKSQQQMVPPQQQIIPSQQQRVPSQQQMVPPQQQMVPSQQQRVPSQQKMVPPQQQMVPPQQQMVPSQVVPQQVTAQQQIVPQQVMPQPQQVISQQQLVPQQVMSQQKIIPQGVMSNGQIVPQQVISQRQMVPLQQYPSSQQITPTIDNTQYIPPVSIQSRTQIHDLADPPPVNQTDQAKLDPNQAHIHSFGDFARTDQINNPHDSRLVKKPTNGLQLQVIPEGEMFMKLIMNDERLQPTEPFTRSPSNFRPTTTKQRQLSANLRSQTEALKTLPSTVMEQQHRKQQTSISSLDRNIAAAIQRSKTASSKLFERQSQIYCGTQAVLPEKKKLSSNVSKPGSKIESRGGTHAPPPKFEPEITPLPKLDRPQTLSLQTGSDDRAESEVHQNNVVNNSELDNIENDFMRVEVSSRPPEVAVEVDAHARKTPSHLTEQGYFDLKFYHNKLW